jgi:membrane protein CcdC involved in cytochrome C biogenesis
MARVLFWIYLINAVLLINHEIDSAYWKEWKLFGLPGEITGFLTLHFPLLFLVLYGLVLIFEGIFAGLIFSLLLSLGGMFAFAAHTYFIRRGWPEFRTTASQVILVATLIVSAIQMAITISLLVA